MPGLRIGLVVSSLGCGGAERVVVLLARELVARGHLCTLVTLDAGTPDFHEVPAGVERVRVDSSRPSHSWVAAIRNNVANVIALGRALARTQPDVVLAFGDTTNVKTLLAAEASRIPVVVSERVDPSTVDIGREWSVLRRLTYPRAAALVVQTESVHAWGLRMVAVERVAVIGNPVDLDDDVPTAARNPEIVAIGRLVPQKGFDVLLRAFARVAAEHPQWRVAILGEGPSRRDLEALATTLGVRAKLELPGQVHDVRARLRRASIFALSSRFEGFPNALVEAMAASTAIIATDCPSGPREILRDCADAILTPVDDEAALASALQTMIADPDRRTRCGASARECVDRYAPVAIVDAWESVIVRAAAR